MSVETPEKNPNLKSYGTPDAPARNQDRDVPTQPWSIKAHLRRLSIEQGQEIAEAIMKKAKKGDMRAANMVIEHLEGKATQTLNIKPTGMISPQQAIPASDAEAAYRRMLDGE